jgi:hypothetical protein
MAESPKDVNVDFEAVLKDIHARVQAERDGLPSDDPRREHDYWWELMCDYGAPPLWRRGALGPSPVAPESLGLPSDLCQRMWAWDDEYNTGQRGWSGAQFCDEGWAIAQLVAEATARPVEFEDVSGVRVAMPGMSR